MKPSKDKIGEIEQYIGKFDDAVITKLNQVIRKVNELEESLGFESKKRQELQPLIYKLEQGQVKEKHVHNMLIMNGNKLESQPEEHKHESQNHRVNELGHTLIYCCSPKKECEWGIHDKCGYPWKFHEQRYDKVQCPKDSKKEGCATCGHRRNEHDLTGCTFIIATPFWRCKCSWNSMDDKEVIYTSEGDAVGEVGGKCCDITEGHKHCEAHGVVRLMHKHGEPPEGETGEPIVEEIPQMEGTLEALSKLNPSIQTEDPKTKEHHEE